jgi:hypothetical protein
LQLLEEKMHLDWVKQSKKSEKQFFKKLSI